MEAPMKMALATVELNTCQIWSSGGVVGVKHYLNPGSLRSY
jgi:hypothetical protein